MRNNRDSSPSLDPAAQLGQPAGAKSESATGDDETEAFGRAVVELRESVGIVETADSSDLPAKVPGSKAPPVQEELARIAQRVRRWRDEGELTLQELARRSGVAASTIQKVETQQMVPTIGVLLKIARGLDRSPAELVRENAGGLHVVHLPAAVRHRVGTSAKITVERLVGDLFEPALEVWRVTQQPGSGSGRELIQFEGETLVVCESGELSFRVGDEEYQVRSGDSLHFKTTLPHGWRTCGTEPAQFLLVGSLPSKLRAVIYERVRS
jgi:transcriptional regulator with XRE-family HTH domain